MAELMSLMKALADKTRYSIVELLLQHNYCVGALDRHLDLSESAVSQHLKILRTTGIVKGEKRGYFTHSTVDRDLLRHAAEELTALSRLEKRETPCSKSEKSRKTRCQKEEETWTSSK